jgi:hypothetical protein
LTTADPYVWDFHFALSDECRFIEIKGPPGIELEINPEMDGMKSVREFIVKVMAKAFCGQYGQNIYKGLCLDLCTVQSFFLRK